MLKHKTYTGFINLSKKKNATFVINNRCFIYCNMVKKTLKTKIKVYLLIILSIVKKWYVEFNFYIDNLRMLSK